MPDALGPTLPEIAREIYQIRHNIERMWHKQARQDRERDDMTLWLQLKEFQKLCPNLPPIRPG